MFLSVTYMDNEPTPSVYSTPPRKSAGGDDRGATITVHPFGPDVAAMFEDGYVAPVPLPEPEKGSVSINLSLAEAEELARRLVVVVQAAKQGIYSNMGEQLKRYTREKRLNEAWQALMSEDDK
ncbi:hypothetical protein [Mycolicibacterium vanbaalenii]|uniref:Uncharacterized protein n=1 Tax=Mycolicibacterium vanbaalenii (strain DSM 7251 / JCM 13017 / BCRC 16820 / KCTC 9966 / NRRL B-24157 / PYR-1) TaxID=350058 RepID=A1TD81_MYCVP|nr:hypothetical protein [Mycolicibacterium vanbaalenii]ABM15131.1 hypothetical protein Mvan_4354 [Mycolicibacterium vanbaalenii PYR-1]MCV7127010.1 hypothetical protein [Mycolicibacterium vanbaalenii PYR-1]